MLSPSLASRRQIGRCAGVAVLALGTAACGSSTPSAAPATSAGTGVNSSAAPGGVPGASAPVQLKGTLTLSGAVSGSKDFVATAKSSLSCNDFASTFEFPGTTANIAGHDTNVDPPKPAAYKGPGTYHLADFGPVEGQTLAVDASSEEEPFQPVPGSGAAADLTVNQDGSGTFSIQNWGDPSSRTQSLKVTWTCNQ